MKEKYISAEMSVVVLSNQDVIRTSNIQGDKVVDTPFAPFSFWSGKSGAASQADF